MSEEKDGDGLHISACVVQSESRAVRVAFPVERPDYENGQHHAVVVRSESGTRVVDAAPRLFFEFHPTNRYRTDSLSRAEWEQVKRAGDRAWNEFELRYMRAATTTCPVDRCECGATSREDHDAREGNTAVRS